MEQARIENLRQALKEVRVMVSFGLEASNTKRGLLDRIDKALQDDGGQPIIRATLELEGEELAAVQAALGEMSELYYAEYNQDPVQSSSKLALAGLCESVYRKVSQTLNT